MARSKAASRRRLVWHGVIVDVRFLAVLTFLVRLVEVMAVGELVMVVLVGVPVRSVLPFGYWQVATVMMRDVIVIVGVRACRMGMGRLAALALSPLHNRAC